MRILRIAQKVYPEVNGGGPFHVHAMSRDQAAMGHDVTLLTVDQGENLPQVEHRDGYTLIRHPAIASPLGNAISPGIATHLLRASEFDVIHAHSHLYFSTNIAALNRWLSETPLAITNHGLYSQNVPKNVFDVYLRTIGRWTLNRADIVFCYTDDEGERLRDKGVKTRIAVVPNGIDTDLFTPDGPESPYIDSDRPSALFVGRLVDGKRPQIALEAISQAIETHPDIQLYLCGEGTLEDELRSFASDLGIEGSIHFLGQIPYYEMPAVYRSADVLVLPSATEGVPRTVLEAISTGLPVVCSQLEQIRDLIEHGERGELVDIDADGGLARAILEWLERDSTPKPLDDTHAWQTTVEQTTEALQSLIY